MALPNGVQVFDNPEALSKAAATFILSTAKKSIAERGRFAIALSGGSTPEKLFTLLAEPPYSNQMPWANTFVFWGDERCVPLNDKNNNALMAKVTLLDKVNIPPANIFVIPTNLPPVEAANTYEAEIKEFFGNGPISFDLTMLGLGENGHTASLFPGTTVLHEKDRLMKEINVPEVNMYRITMTAPFINQSRVVLFLVAGKAKAEVLKTVLTAPYQPDKYPAQLIKPGNGELIWFADKAATALLA